MPSPIKCGRQRRKSRGIPVRSSRIWRWSAAELGQSWGLRVYLAPLSWSPCHWLERENGGGSRRAWSARLVAPPPSICPPSPPRAGPSRSREREIGWSERDEVVVPIRGLFPRDKGRVFISLRNEGDWGELERSETLGGINRTFYRKASGLNPRGFDPY
jgi:hypothetical protein